MSAFALFFQIAISLAFDKHRVEEELGDHLPIDHVPCDTRCARYSIPSPRISASAVQVFGQLQRGKALESMMFLDDYYLLALDGTEYFLKTIHCASCLHKGPPQLVDHVFPQMLVRRWSIRTSGL